MGWGGERRFCPLCWVLKFGRTPLPFQLWVHLGGGNQRALLKLGDGLHPWVFPYLGKKVRGHVLGCFPSGNPLRLYFPPKLR